MRNWAVSRSHSGRIFDGETKRIPGNSGICIQDIVEKEPKYTGYSIINRVRIKNLFWGQPHHPEKGKTLHPIATTKQALHELFEGKKEDYWLMERKL